MVDEAEAIAGARALVTGASRIVVLAGAGISTGSGIPDFRGPDGVWTKNPEAEMMSTFDVYVDDEGVRAAAWRHRADSPMWEASPNAAHRALVDLERSGRLDLLVTQNIDGLHHAAEQDPGVVVEIHGNVRDVVCLSCDARGPMDATIERVRAGEADPRCETCGGILKSATISFGQALVARDLERSFAAAERCDLFIAVGTSLGVYPVAELPRMARRNGAPLIIANAEPTPMDAMARYVLRGDLVEVLPAVLGGLEQV